MRAWEELVEQHQAPARRGHDPRRRQVRRLRGLLQEPQRGALPRRLRASAAHQHPVGRGRGARAGRRHAAARRRDRHPRARRLRHPRHARHDEGGRVRAHARGPLLRHLLRLPVGDGRVRPQRLRPRRRRLDRVRRGDAAQGDLQAARPARRRRPGRHDAARPLRLRAGARARWPAASTAPTSSTSATATATSSTRLYEPALTEHGLRISGRSPDGKFVEIAELPGHPWFLGVQFHPEFKSRPLRPHPLFASFVEASYRHRQSRARPGEPGERDCLTMTPRSCR